MCSRYFRCADKVRKRQTENYRRIQLLGENISFIFFAGQQAKKTNKRKNRHEKTTAKKINKMKLFRIDKSLFFRNSVLAIRQFAPDVNTAVLPNWVFEKLGHISNALAADEHEMDKNGNYSANSWSKKFIL